MIVECCKTGKQEVPCKPAKSTGMSKDVIKDRAITYAKSKGWSDHDLNSSNTDSAIQAKNCVDDYIAGWEAAMREVDRQNNDWENSVIRRAYGG